ncbi:MAG: hypothetical protein RL386_793 [Bacteroidota bacterium]
MGVTTIKGENGEIRLRKSKRLAGLRISTSSRSLTPPDYVRQEVYPQIGGFTLVELDTSDMPLEDKLDAVRQLDEVELGTHVYYPEGSNRPLVPNGYIFLTFEEGVSEEEEKIVLDEFALELAERRQPGFLLVKVTAQSPNPIKTAELAQASCLVKTAQPDWDTILDEYTVVPSDPLFSHQWHLQNNGFLPDTNVPLTRGADIRVLSAWRRLGGMGSPNITVAVIDNGFDMSHADFQGKIVRPLDLATRSAIIPQGNTKTTHGTPCASLAIAGANGTGIVGVAPNAKFLPFNGTSYSDVENEFMFNYCAANGADVISCSWGTTDVEMPVGARKKEAIARVAREGRGGKGCVVVFAVGNESLPYINHYAVIPEVIAVAACTSDNQHASYSNQGLEVTVCAPSSASNWPVTAGWPVTAARAYWDPGTEGKAGENRYWVDGRSRGNAHKHFGGTSAAAPIVAGVCALILSANPNLTAREVKDILIQTADKIGNSWEYVAGHSRKYGYGRVNAENAVAEALRRKGSPGQVAPQPQQPTVTPGQVPGTGWGIQMGAFHTYENTFHLVSRLKNNYAHPVSVFESRASGQVLFVVMIGNFATVQQASALQAQLQAGGLNGFVKNFADLA